MSKPDIDLMTLLGEGFARELATLPNPWKVSEAVSLPDRQAYKITLDGVRFNFFILHETAASLTWMGDVPDDLMPGGDEADLINFLDFTTVYLPGLLYKNDDEKTIRGTYGRNSDIVIDFLDGQTITYNLSRYSDLAILRDELLTENVRNDIRSYGVGGYVDSDKSIRDSFNFEVKYLHPGNNKLSQFGLEVPLLPGHELVFNPDLLRWAFSVNNGFTDPSPALQRRIENGEAFSLAHDLSEIITTRFPKP